jgi:hypothetical protein
LALQELEYNWRGEFSQQRGGANYMIIGKKLPSENTLKLE